ncbi:MAG TPA: heavy metal sensor histidine kinase [Gemmataceae bacterium]|jgi:two-component system heavy metal sensor histidine kinase CusS
MSSKTVPDVTQPNHSSRQSVKAWSLAARLTAWYAGSAFILVLAATGFLYWATVRNLDREDNQRLGDRVRELRAVMQSRPGDMAAIRQEMEEEEAHERARVHLRILDGEGQVVIETPGMNQLLPPSSFPVPLAEPTTGIDMDLGNARSFLVLAVSVTDGSPERSSFVIQVAMDRSLQTELLASYRKNLLLVLAMALVVCAVVGYWIAHRGIRPIHDIAETARRIHPTNLSERMSPDGLPAELLTLAATFNQMLDRLEQSFNRLSRFSADIAHELRTPVSSLRGEVEVALSKPRSPEEYREALASSLEECGRLAHLIDRMLFLARAENPQTQITKERCAIAEELARVCEFYGLAAAEAGVRLTIDVEKNVQADLDRALFQRAVGNVVANALAHTPSGGSVTLCATGDERSTRVEVFDTGCGISADHLLHVFDRFYRAENARSSRNGNVGLGLAIVRTITELHGGTVEIASEEGRGTHVTMRFPKEETSASTPPQRPSPRRGT